MFIFKHTTKQYSKDDYQNDIQKNVITTEGIAVYNLEKEIRDDKQREIDKEQLIKNQLLQVNQSVIDTNGSIATLNVKTLKNFRVQKRLTWAIFIAAAVSAIAAIIPLFRDEKSTLQPLQDTLKSVQMKVQNS
ncbi:hypothetical protein [Ferruginibacter sp.]|uniref:hypothetical protein n=1 Tax=Ferruginibacter sp. TaxID=1940288 RepID=UPI00374CB9EC